MRAFEHRLRALEAVTKAAERAGMDADTARARILAKLDAIAARAGPSTAPADPARLAELRLRMVALHR